MTIWGREDLRLSFVCFKHMERTLGQRKCAFKFKHLDLVGYINRHFRTCSGLFFCHITSCDCRGKNKKKTSGSQKNYVIQKKHTENHQIHIYGWTECQKKWKYIPDATTKRIWPVILWVALVSVCLARRGAVLSWLILCNGCFCWNQTNLIRQTRSTAISTFFASWLVSKPF